MMAQNGVNHYEKKLDDEQTKAKALEEAAKVVQEEFEVCANCLRITYANTMSDLDYQSRGLLRKSGEPKTGGGCQAKS